MNQKVWISAGGTGGHIYPAIAIYELLLKQGLSVTFIGGDQNSMEQTICHEHQIHFHSTNNLKWLGWHKVFFWFSQLCSSLWDLFKLVRKEKPALILIMCGYPCITSGLIAIMTRTPLLLHEQNAVLGQTNRFFYHFIKEGFCAYKSLTKQWPKLKCVGNPSSIIAIKKPNVYPNGTFNILSFGGSGGAKQLNELMMAVIKSELLNDCAFWLITGDQGEDIKLDHAAHIKIEKYNHKIEEAYQWADLAITRSGAMTLTELNLAGLPALFLPYPYATDNHQHVNASYYVKHGGALMCEQTPERLVKQIKTIKDNKLNYNQMAKSMFKLIPQKNASKSIVDVLLRLVKEA